MKKKESGERGSGGFVNEKIRGVVEGEMVVLWMKKRGVKEEVG